MEVKKIYFDMDGVLADFDRGVVELAGGTPLSQDEIRTVGVDDNIWEKIRAVDHFYDKLELMPGAREMFDLIYSSFGDKCEILTGIPKPKRRIESAAEDKIDWVRRLLSDDVVVNIVFKEEKPEYCTGRDCILIDDNRNNIESWEASGGTGILYRSAEQTIEELERLGAM